MFCGHFRDHFGVPEGEAPGHGERISVSWGRGLGEGVGKLFGTNLEGPNVVSVIANTLFTGSPPPPGPLPREDKPGFLVFPLQTFCLNSYTWFA